MKNYEICIVGLGYVGLPLAIAFAKKYSVTAYDINKKRILELQDNFDHTNEISREDIKNANKNIKFTHKQSDIEKSNVYIITVPTPIDSYNKPNLKPLIDSSKTVGKALKNGDIVVYESTVYPGATEDVCIPVLEETSGLKFNKDFFCGYSPERINPGDKERTVTKIMKVTSGSTKEIAKEIDELYKNIIEAGTFLVSSIKVAEASKVIENIQRDVNIALINELALIFDRMDISTHEVIEASSTKWNFIKFLPGLVGGHCIGVDPYYLSFKAEVEGYKPDLINTARLINDGMSRYVVDKTIKIMIKNMGTVKNANVLILGLAFKEDCPDTRNSKVVDIVKELKSYEVNISIYDPWVHSHEEDEINSLLINNPLESQSKFDAIIIPVAHKEFRDYTNDDFKKLSVDEPIIIDIKNITDIKTWTL